MGEKNYKNPKEDIHRQEAMIRKEISDYQGNQKQRDDITILGLIP